MHVNFISPTHGSSNYPPFPQLSNNLIPSNHTSAQMFQQTTTQQLLPSHYQNPPHVLPGNAGFQAPLPFSSIPDLQIIKSVPPPPLMTSHFPGVNISESPPQWNPSQMNNNFINQSNQFPSRPQSTPSFPPPMLPPTNCNNNNNGTYLCSNAFNSQQNVMQNASAHQAAYERNQVVAPRNMYPNSSVQQTANSFDYHNRVGRNQIYGEAGSSNDRNSPNYNGNNKTLYGVTKTYVGRNPPGFASVSNISHNVNEQIRQKSPFMMEPSGEIPYNGNKFHQYNRGVKRQNSFRLCDSYSKKSFSTSQVNRQNNMRSSNGYGERNVKTEWNNEVSKPYSCDTCDRAFALEAELMYHLSEHIKCNSGNCQFEAHPKIVALHKKMQHDTGYADTISKLKNADEIEKWRAERRRRFPTKENIEKRKAEFAEKEARGEVIENREFGKFKGQSNQQNGCQNNDRMNPKKRRRGGYKMKNAFKAPDYPHSVSKSTVTISDSGSDSDDDSHIKLPKFLGMTSLPENRNLPYNQNLPKNDKLPQNGNLSEIENLESHAGEFSDEETNDVAPNKSFDSIPIQTSDDDTPTEHSINEKTSMNESVEIVSELRQNKILDLTIDVNSDDESPIELPMEKNQSIPKGDMLQRKDSNKVIDIDSDDGPPIELPLRKNVSSINQNIEKDDVLQNSASNSAIGGNSGDKPTLKLPNNMGSINQGIEREARGDGNRISKAKFPRDFNIRKEYPVLPRKSSLLEKLLVDEIRHERNVIMQCVRHVVKNDFFDNVNN